MMRPVPLIAGWLGVVFLVLAGVYFIEPAGSLPSFLPGFEPGGTHIHVTHGIGALVFGIILLGVAWFGRESKEA